MLPTFYRSLEPKRLWRGVAKSAAKNKRRTAFIVLGALLFLYFLFDNKGLINRVRLEGKRQELIDQVRTDSLESQRLQAQIKALQGDKKTIEKLAREKYGMARPGETVYRVKKDS
jgi:cell division protein FtsB